MRYDGTDHVEVIKFSATDNEYAIELTRLANEPVFCVDCSWVCDWFYVFWMENNSVYEQIKYNIMERIFESGSKEELLDALSDVFEKGFQDVMIDDECCCSECREHDYYLN